MEGCREISLHKQMDLTDYINLVRSLRDDYSEEIPSEMISSTDQKDGPRFKVRKAWFQGVSFVLEDGVRRGYLLPEYTQKMHEFHTRNRETGFHRRRTTREDIAYTNGILNDILAQIS